MPVTINPAFPKVPLKTYDQTWKVVYFDNNNTEVTILDSTTNDSNMILGGRFTLKSLRTGIGDFNIEALNYKGRFNTIFTNGRRIKVYGDLSSSTTTPTTVLFDGYVDSKKHTLTGDGEFLINIYGRKNPQLMDLHITRDYSGGTAADAAIRDIIDTFFSGIITYVNISTAMTGTIIREYIDTPAIEVISDILKQVEYDGYIDMSNDIHTFKPNENQNSVAKIVYGDNMLPFGEVGYDFLEKFNRVIVYGASTDKSLLLRTKNNLPDQTVTWIKSTVLSEGNLQTVSSVNQKADVELTNSQNIPFFGTLSSAHILPTLNPGETFFCSAQYGEINGFHTAVSITHNLVSGGVGTTDVDINKKETTSFIEIKSVGEKINALSNNNLRRMTDTAILFVFDNEDGIASLGGLKVENGRLKIASSNQGTMTSNTNTIDNNPSQFEIRVNANTDCAISYYQISFDNGQTFNESNKQYNLIGETNRAISVTTSGKKVLIKITLRSDSTYVSPEVESLTVLVR